MDVFASERFDNFFRRIAIIVAKAMDKIVLPNPINKECLQRSEARLTCPRFSVPP